MAEVNRFRAKREPAPTPRGLRGKARAFCLKVLRDFELDPFHLDILERACWALQRCEESGATLAKEGNFYTDNKGRILRHPALITIEKSEMLFTRFVRELGLDIASEQARPPARTGRRSR